MCRLLNIDLCRRERCVPVDWHDCACSVPVMVRRFPAPATACTRHPVAKSWSARSLHYNNAARQNFTPCSAMKNHPAARRSLSGFTLVELLTVIAIIAILAAMLLPVLSIAKIHSQKVQAKLEESALVQGIEAYDSAYGRFPVSAAAQAQAGQLASHVTATANLGDFTYGASVPTPSGINPIGTQINGSVISNAEVISILMDYTNYPAYPGQCTVNTNHTKNPQLTQFLNPKMAIATNSPGVGPDLVYRDPWGTPYFITMDLNYDEQSDDVFYGRQAVSQNGTGQTGYNGLFNSDTGGNTDHYQFHGKVMVWSAGPDRKVDPNSRAINGANKDNVVSWQ